MFKNRFELCPDHKTAVYCIVNLDNLKMYIGQTRDTYTRSRQHDYHLRHGKHNKSMQFDYNNGAHFKFDIIQEYEPGTDRNELLRLERLCINIAIEKGFILYNSDVTTNSKIYYLEQEKKAEKQRIIIQERERKIKERQEMRRYFDISDGINPNETQRERELKEIDRYLYNA